EVATPSRARNWFVPPGTVEARRRWQTRRAADWAMAVGTAWPTIRDREPAGCQRQYPHRNGRAGAARRARAAPDQLVSPDQRAAGLTRGDRAGAGIMRNLDFSCSGHPSAPTTSALISGADAGGQAAAAVWTKAASGPYPIETPSNMRQSMGS